jgi:hypothetical protein|tara:strand:- start:243 stop:800 length:558 start_codon:yes stop_codon:yes gene_type:complete
MALVLDGSNDTITGLQINSANIVNGSITADDLASGVASPSGTAVQMVQTYHNSQVTISGTSEQDYGLTATITPKASGNKILVSMTGCLGSSATDNFGRGLFKVSVGGGSYSDIGAHFFLGNRMSHASKDVEVWTHDFLYTTSSASAHSFKLYYRVIDGGNMTIGGWSNDSNWLHRTVCTLTEVAA